MNCYRYWGLKQAPFDNVPDPRMYWPQNPSLEDAISEVLFAIEEGNECLAVIVGDIGTGKTLALRILLNELTPGKYKIAFLTNPALTFAQIIREIIGQLENKKVYTKWKDRLYEEFNQTLYQSANEGKRVVIFIDEANVLSTGSLQGLRLLTNMQDDQQNLVTFVLAGQKELAQKLERPSMENLYQRIGVYCKVRGLDSPEMIGRYVAHRLKQAGCSREIFTERAINTIWNYSRGIPRLVNKLGKLSLKAGETNQLQVVDEKVVERLAYMFKKGFFKKGGTARHKEVSTVQTGTKHQILGETPPLESEVREEITVLKGSRWSSKSLMDKDPSREGMLPTKEAELKKAYQNLDTGDNTQTGYKMEELIKYIPPKVLNRLYTMDEQQLYRLAGQLAASRLRKDETVENSGDPIVQWEKLRSVIVISLKKISRLQRVGQVTEYC